MTIFKPLKYSCFQICSIDDTNSLIEFVLDQNQSFNLNQTNYVKTGNQNKQRHDEEITKTNKRKLKTKENVNRCPKNIG